jgi:hypothetical protein
MLMRRCGRIAVTAASALLSFAVAAQAEEGAAGAVERSMESAAGATERGLRRAGEATGNAIGTAIDKTGKGIGTAIDKTGQGLQRAGEALSGSAPQRPADPPAHELRESDLPPEGSEATIEPDPEPYPEPYPPVE